MTWRSEDPGYEDLAAIGTVGQIKQVLGAPGENTRVLVEGLFRANLKDLTRTTLIWRAMGGHF